MNSMNIEIPKGYGIDVDESNLETGEIVFKEIERKLPESMDELNEQLSDDSCGYYINGSDDVAQIRLLHWSFERLYSSPEIANAANAIAELSMLRDYYRNGWEPDWSSNDTTKHVISFDSGEVIRDWYCSTQRFLAFKTAEQRDHFLKHHEDLILQAMPILGG